jgi:hypothetical protein
MLLHQGKTRDKKDFLQTLFCTTERNEELLTPSMGILGSFMAMAIVGGL